MKTKVLTGVSFLLVMVGCLVIGQPANAQHEKRMTRCCNHIPDLSEQQKEKIHQMQTMHLSRIEKLQAEKRQQKGWKEKLAYREKMNSIREAHRKEIRSILTEEQTRYFDRRYAYVKSDPEKIHAREPNKALGRSAPANKGKPGKRTGQK